MDIDPLRVTDINRADVQRSGNFVLYWMVANRRLTYNFALQRAVEWCVELQKPLLILEALKCDYEWASLRLHRFVLQGMSDNRAAAESLGVDYFPYVEPVPGAGNGLLAALSSNATVVVTDDFPCFFLPRMIRSAGNQLPVRLEAVDSNGIYPMRATDRVFTKAFSFRLHLQKNLAPHLERFPAADPLSTPDLPKARCIPPEMLERWPAANPALLSATTAAITELGVDPTVGPAVLNGGPVAAREQLTQFLRNRFHRYADDRNQPDNDPSSGLSPYLHFGHISAHEVFREVADGEEWSVCDLNDSKTTKGSRNGWWNMSPAAESFLDELITWRELGYNAGCHDEKFDQFESLPDFAIKTLADHESDDRPVLYSLEQLRDAQTHDEIWNAAQTQLVTEGRMHNYLRMLWGKKILEWSQNAQQALATMVELNNRYAVDGRNPNSYSGILWVLGKYDRAWGPERPIFGKVRYMSSDSTRRKLKLKSYLKKYGPKDPEELF